jgi:2-polyprenyl-6-methoxyphenol hydroxylase-like FAD-dependent oxidoreductase
MNDSSILIAGAGPTGLALALWLTRLGIRVRIIDRSTGPGLTSRALAVQVRTLEFYRQLGIADLVIDGGVQVAALNFWVQGSRAARVPLRQIGEGLSPYPFALIYPQDAHERLLISQLEQLGVTVERQTELIRMSQDDAGVSVTLRLPNGAEESKRVDYLAGCDGASSTVREQLGIGFPGGTYSGVFYVADADAAGPAVDRELHVDLEDADFVLLFPMKEQGRVRLVGTVRESDKAQRGELSFDDVRGKAIEHLRLTVGQVHWFSTYRVHHRVANSFRQGRVFLLGDAAHIHSPVGGQGMNTGIGDAVNLSWKLAAVLKGRAASSLLDSYEPERIAFARRLVATTDRGFTIVTRRGPIARFVRTRLVPLLVPPLFRLPRFRRFLFRTVSQIVVNYRGGRLSAGSAGSIRAGDRLPWVPIREGEDNFAPLASIGWQAHQYGETRAGLAEACTTLGLPLHLFPWIPAMETAGFQRGALYLIRPDGYVALADPEPSPDRLRRYLDERGITLA